MKEQLKGLALPLLAAAYPIIFLYGHNAWALQLGNLKVPLEYSWLIGIASYSLFFLFQHKPVSASLSATIFMVFFFTYGYFYRLLLKQDQFLVDHFIILPVIVAAAAYAGYLIGLIKPVVLKIAQGILLVVAGFLVVYNVGITAGVEVQKAKQAKKPTAPVQDSGISITSNQKLPDIYYIIFDEYVGFNGMRDYWHNNDVNTFDNFLKAHGFFVAENSHSPTINTQTEMASRLNLHPYTEDMSTDITRQALDNSKVMQVLKAHGYTTAVLNMFFHDIQADYTLNYDPQQISGMASQQFEQSFLDNSMLDAFSDYFADDDSAEVKQRDIIYYTLDRTANLTEVKSPKFVYTHLLLPHEPFIFDKDGKLIPPQYGDDWNYYLGQYQYATKLAQDLVTRLLAHADPSNPPIIILQSDEGARNLQRRTSDNIVMNGYLENYPAQYASLILNALYLPGYDNSQLKDDMAPIDTFVIVLNHYLNAGVSIDNSPVK